MDQNSTGGSDKRNWRERLGIGTKDAAIMGKEMPRAADDFKPATPVVVQEVKPPTATVKPAPMAPRPAARPAPTPVAAAGSARPAAARPPTMSPDALSNKLKSQREAAEKLAEQRVQAAKQRAEAALPASINGNAERPKFTFADDEPRVAPRPAMPAQTSNPQIQRPASPPPAASVGFNPQIAPPRPALGGGQSMPPRPAAMPPAYPPQAYPQGQPYYPQQQPQYPQGYAQQGYALPPPPPGYRPIDPASGYAPPPPYNPQMRPQYAPVGAPPQPRLQMPNRPPSTGFNTPQAGFGAELSQRPNPRLTNPPKPAYAAQEDATEDDIFEQSSPPPRPTRRATADDYSQALREVETGYEDEETRSNSPLIFLLLMALAVAAGLLGWWGYNHYIKNPSVASTTQTSVPVVPAADKSAKAMPDAAAAESATAGKAVNSSKKLIYDRIVGDHEVPGGQLVPSEETPVQPANNSAPAIAPAAKAGDTTSPSAVPAPGDTGTGADGTPLPLPPPPGGTNGTQGSLEPSGKGDSGKTDQATISPTNATPSAESSSSVKVGDVAAGAVGVSGTAVVAAGSETIAPAAAASKPAAEVAMVTPGAEAISPVDKTVDATPAIKEKKMTSKPATVKKLASANEKTTKSLGARPVILVPPSRIATQTKIASKSAASAPVISSNDGLYGDTAVGGTQVADTAIDQSGAAPKKRRSLIDLFKTNSATNTDSAVASTAPAVQVAQAPTIPKPAPKLVSAAPSAGTGAFVAQLASFKTKAEASSEYSRMVAKHGALIQRYAPIIEQAQVAGSTRYRLNIGPMASNDVATSFCSSLFAAGERDCLVHRQ